ncbi:MAG: S9 family peptidase [Bacteriovoracaceae bacterium]|nr:S9 family peptidase [Bacteriovoracaceae bacterium]
MKYILIMCVFFSCATISNLNEKNHNYLYLENLQGEKSLEFVKRHNKQSQAQFKEHDLYNEIEKGALKILDNPEKTPKGTIHGKYLINFWRDKFSVRGILRKMLLTKYLEGSNEWKTVVDIDKLARQDKKNWNYKRFIVEQKKNKRAILYLSEGGKSAFVFKEFDLVSGKFIANGFSSETEAKSNISWVDENHIVIGSDFGKGTLSKSGYPKMLKLWKRGQKLEDAKVMIKVDDSYSSVRSIVDVTDVTDAVDGKILIVAQKTVYQREYYDYNLKTLKLKKYSLPSFISFETRKDNYLLVSTREDWNVNGKSFKAGDLIKIHEPDLLKGQLKAELLFSPKENQSLLDIYKTKTNLIIRLLEDVAPKLLVLRPINNRWIFEELKLPEKLGTAELLSVNGTRDDFFVSHESFLIPNSLYYFNFKKSKMRLVKRQRSGFNEDDFVEQQFFAISKDKIKIPYFLVSKKNLTLDGNNPTLLEAYGGFMNPSLPYYSELTGKNWLERGGVLIIANIRGGSEYGPSWHKSAKKEKRQNSFDDFIAVAEDLIARNITNPSKLAIGGGSNGGLLVGVALTQRPDLFSAVICNVPILDMERFHKFLSGHSWIGEYGDPDKEEDLKYLLKYSPFHNLKPGVGYSRPFFYSSTLDDTVHPAHARKMVAKLEDLGQKVLYYENTEGGHDGESNNKQRAVKAAMNYVYLYQQLGMQTDK